MRAPKRLGLSLRSPGMLLWRGGWQRFHRSYGASSWPQKWVPFSVPVFGRFKLNRQVGTRFWVPKSVPKLGTRIGTTERFFAD